MSHPQCGNCDRPTGDGAAICSHCTTGLMHALRDVPDLMENLLITYAKQDRIASGGKRGKGAEQPLPVRLDITPVLHALGNELTTWARDLAERHGWDVPGPPRRRPYSTAKPGVPAAGAQNLRRGEVGRGLGEPVLPATTAQLDLIAYAACWLADHAGHLRTHPAAMEAHRGITGAIASTELAIDKPEPQLMVGYCEVCTGPLYALRKATSTKCERCGAYVSNLAERWDRAKLRLRGYPATAADIAGWVSELYDIHVKEGTIRKWHQRDELTPADWVALTEGGERTVPRFRIGAVLDRAAKSKPRKAG